MEGDRTELLTSRVDLGVDFGTICVMLISKKIKCVMLVVCFLIYIIVRWCQGWWDDEAERAVNGTHHGRHIPIHIPAITSWNYSVHGQGGTSGPFGENGKDEQDPGAPQPTALTDR